MRSRRFRILLAVLLTILQLASIASAQSKSDLEEQCVAELIEEVIHDRPVADDASKLLPILLRKLVTSNSPEPEILILAIERLKPTSEFAVKILCFKLDDPSQAVRSASVNALVAVGTSSIAQLESTIKSKSGRARAAALDALGRLKDVPLADLETFADDPDARVRGVVARQFRKNEQQGVKLLTKLLQDDETAVAVEAAESLGVNQSDATLALFALKATLKRPIVGSAAAKALAKWGVVARRAIPAIIRAYPLGPNGNYSIWSDVAEEVLRHLGPPDPADLHELIELLLLENEEAQILAATYLSLMGKEGRPAAPALKHAIEVTTQRASEMHAKFGRDNPKNHSGRVSLAVETLKTAFWRVTENIDEFLTLEEPFERVTFPLNPLFDEFNERDQLSSSDVQLTKQILTNGNVELRSKALRFISENTSAAHQLKDLLIEQIHDPNTPNVVETLAAVAALGSSVADQVSERINKLFADGVIGIQDLAVAVEKLEIRSPASQSALEGGLTIGTRTTKIACAKALAKVTADPHRTAKLIISCAGGLGGFQHRDAIDSLREITAAGEMIIPYLKAQATDEDMWTRHAAIRALGELGPDAAPALATVETCLGDKSEEVRIQAAIAIFRIQNKLEPLEKELHDCLFSSTSIRRYQAFRAIEQLGAAGAAYLHCVIDALNEPESELEPTLIDALAAIKTTDAISELEGLALSNDWVRRRLALSALKRSKEEQSK